MKTFERPAFQIPREPCTRVNSFMRHRRVLVVGNYSADQVQSMFRFADLLVSIYSHDTQAVLVRPPVLVGRLPFLPSVLRKYIAYIDKLLLFPLWLAIRSRGFDLVHIADQGNSFYSFCCPRSKSLVTCHDLLAMRSAFGDTSTACTLSPIGIWLQRLIKAGLQRASAVVFDSEATIQDFQKVIGSQPHQRLDVIPLPLNASFYPNINAFPLLTSEESQIPKVPYLLMVGSSHPRKNRALALKLLEYLGPDVPFHVVLAGAPFTTVEQDFHIKHPLGAQLSSIPMPSHALLNRLYCKAHALLFPSFSEGFGWPLVEAQTCCCPVIASSTTSIPEVAGDGALYAEPTDVASFAAHVRTLEDPMERTRLIKLGLINTRRFDKDVVSEAYRRFAFQF